MHLEFAAEDQVGFGTNGDVIIKEKAQNRLHKYQLQIKEGNVYPEIWSEDFPCGVNTARIIAIDFIGNFLLLYDKSTSTVLKFCENGRKLIESWRGILLACVAQTGPVHVEETDGKYEIIIDNYGSSIARLQPVAGRRPWTHPYLSVCADERDRLAVYISTPYIGYLSHAYQ